jgi:hypothetical protein
MIGKNPLWVSRQHGHSLTTMFRTYAAWTDGALESDVAIIRSAMNDERSAIEAASSELPVKSASVAGLGTGLATRPEWPKKQLAEIKENLKWRRGWDSNSKTPIEISKFMKYLTLCVPRRPLLYPHLAADLAVGHPPNIE